MKIKIIHVTTLLIIILSFSNCTVFLNCILTYDDFNETYDFNYSKEVLKDKVVAAYTYKDSRSYLNIGKSFIGNEQLDTTRQIDLELRLNSENWDQFKSEIRANTPDTLSISIGKMFSFKHIKFTLIVNGDDKNSQLTIQKIKYIRPKACKKEPDFYREKAAKKIRKKFIKKLMRE